MSNGIEDSRIRPLNDEPVRDGAYVLYWMQQAQRSRFNHALEYAVREANARDLPVIVGFGLTDRYPEATERHYAFMLEGLRDVKEDLARRKIGFVVRRGSPESVASSLSRDASLVVCDRGYLRHQKSWRRRVARSAGRRVVQVETDVVVPVDEVSDKHETAARTIRPKIHRLWDRYLAGLSETRANRDSRRLGVGADVDPGDVDGTLRRLRIDRGVRRVRSFCGGASRARRLLGEFLRHRMDGYAERRNEPSRWQVSFMSPYLHFGQISPLEIALKVRGAGKVASDDKAAYLEELIVRRELSMNFVQRHAGYDKYSCLPDWARKTLDEHRDDPRETVYTRSELERAETHDPYWNAAMREMVHTGFMHNYMRMYWGKKILEWTRTPEHAFRTTLRLNNRYFLDGRDPNSFANVAWCFGLHDRAWTERPVFGKVRYMNAAGLERKFDMDAYVAAVDERIQEEGE